MSAKKHYPKTPGAELAMLRKQAGVKGQVEMLAVREIDVNEGIDLTHGCGTGSASGSGDAQREQLVVFRDGPIWRIARGLACYQSLQKFVRSSGSSGRVALVEGNQARQEGTDCDRATAV